jgi:hypothetical protein
MDGLVREEAGNDCVKIVGLGSHTCKCRHSALEVGCTGELELGDVARRRRVLLPIPAPSPAPLRSELSNVSCKSHCPHDAIATKDKRTKHHKHY